MHVKSLEVDILFNKGKAEQTEKSKTLLDLKGDEDKGQSIVPKIGETDRQTQRHTQDTLARLKSFIPPNPGRSLLS